MFVVDATTRMPESELSTLEALNHTAAATIEILRGLRDVIVRLPADSALRELLEKQMRELAMLANTHECDRYRVLNLQLRHQV